LLYLNRWIEYSIVPVAMYFVSTRILTLAIDYANNLTNLLVRNHVGTITGEGNISIEYTRMASDRAAQYFIVWTAYTKIRIFLVPDLTNYTQLPAPVVLPAANSTSTIHFNNNRQLIAV
jgi:hypothetical protein